MLDGLVREGGAGSGGMYGDGFDEAQRSNAVNAMTMSCCN